MANPTTNFGWVMPTSTDLVTDLPADFAIFGQAVDTSMAELKGGTTGQVLSKTSNTDMDFTWVAQDDSNAIQNAIVDAKGDLITATAADTPARLAVGTNNQVLTADSTAATGLKWASPTSKVVQIVAATTNTQVSMSSTTYADTNLTATITPTSASNKVLVLVSQNGLGKTGSTTTTYFLQLLRTSTNIATFTQQGGFVKTIDEVYTGSASIAILDSPATTSATTYKTQIKASAATFAVHAQYYNPDSSIILMEVTP